MNVPPEVRSVCGVSKSRCGVRMSPRLWTCAPPKAPAPSLIHLQDRVGRMIRMWNSSCDGDRMIVSGFCREYRENRDLCTCIFKSLTCHYLCVPPESSLWESVTAVMCVPYTNALHTCRVRDMVITDVRLSIITWETRFLLHLSVSPWNSSFLSCLFHPVPT